jgi:Tol biopolymer transport system component
MSRRSGILVLGILLITPGFAQKLAPPPDHDILLLNPAGHFVIDGQAAVYALFRQDHEFKKKPQRLVTGAGSPRVSPDGKRVAYLCRGATLAVELCVADLNGKNERHVVTGKSGFSVLSISWSPDGRRLAIASDGNKKTGVYIISEDGGEEKVSAAKAGEVAWSPDGKQIVYSAAADGTDVRIATSRWVVATATGMWLEPLGPRFRQVDLYAIDLVTRKEQRLTQYANTNMNPAWSPDGKLLAFASNRTGRYGIYILETATGEVHPFVSGKQWHARHPAWSPDGQTLVFEILETHEERIHIMMIQGTEQIMTMTLDGKRRVLGRGSSPQFIP